MSDRAMSRRARFVSSVSLALLGACVLPADPENDTETSNSTDSASATATDPTVAATSGDAESTTTADTTADTGSGGCAPVDPEDLGECVPYTPADVAGAYAGAWTTGRDSVVLPIEIGDPGGGLVEVRVSAGETASTAFVRRPGAPVEEIHYGADFGGDLEPEETFVFRAQGDEHYELVLEPFVGPGDGDNSFEVEWSYRPNIDCYEHDDTVEEARRIPLDVEIEAYAHAGIIAGDGILVGPSMVDFYRVELDTATTLQVEITKPSDEPLVFELWDPASESGVELIGPLAEGGTPLLSETLELEAGTHYLRVGHFVSDYSTLNLRDPIPASWDHPYRLALRRVDEACDG